MEIMDDDRCRYGYDVIEELVGKNVTEDDAIKWPCDVRTCWAEIQPLVKLTRWLLSYGTSVVITSGIILNTLSLIVLTRKRMRKKTANVYLSFLAVYDNCTLIFNFLIGVLRGNSEAVNGFFQANVGACILYAVAVELFNLLSVWIIVTFTVERFLMVKFPLQSRAWSPKRTVIASVIVSIIVTIISFHKIGFTGFEGDSVYGFKPCKSNRKMSGALIYTHIALKTWIPTVIIVCLNTYIVIEITRNQRKRKQMVQTVITSSDEKATRLLLIVSTSYVLFVLPVGIIKTGEVFWHWTRMVPPGVSTYSKFMITKIRMKWARAFFFFFYQINFTINFFLYVASSKATRFRANLKKVVGMNVSISTNDNRAGTGKTGTVVTVQTIRMKLDQRNPGTVSKNNNTVSMENGIETKVTQTRM